MNTRIYPATFQLERDNSIKIELELSNNNLIRGKRYYFQGIERDVHLIYDLPYSKIAGKKDLNKLDN